MCPEHFRSGASKYFRFGTGYMRQGYSPSYPLRDERITEDRLKLANLFRRQFYILFGLGLLALTGMAVGALATWNVADPSFSHATDNPVTNALGYPGAVFSDIAHAVFRSGECSRSASARRLVAADDDTRRHWPRSQAQFRVGSALHSCLQPSPAASPCRKAGRCRLVSVASSAT